MIMTHKIISKNFLSCLLTLPPEHSVTRGHSKKIFKQRSLVRERSHFFSQRVTNMWNLLSQDAVAADSTGAFKRSLDKEWLPV